MIMKRLARAGILLAIILAARAGGGASEEAFRNAGGTLPPLERAPSADGVAGDAEWRGAARIAGFTAIGAKPLLDPRGGYTLVGYDAGGLHIAVVSDLPPDGRLVTAVTRHDENVCHDDSVEIWIDPTRANKLAGKGDQRYYQLIVNDLGTLLDVCFDPVAGVPNSGWDLKGHSFGSRKDAAAKTWTVEMTIPWASLGVRYGDVRGRDLGLMIARNWKRPWAQQPFLPVGGFSEWRRYALFALREDAPVVRELSFGPVFDGVFGYRLAVANPSGAARKAAVRVRVDSSTMPSVERAAELEVPAGGEVPYVFATREGQFNREGEHTLAAEVVSADGTVLFRRSLVVRPPRDRVWEVAGGADDAAGYRIAFYPSLSLVSVRLDLSLVEGAAAVAQADVAVLDAKGARIAAGPLRLAKSVGEANFPLPAALPDGVYTVRATVPSVPALKPYERTFERRRFVWEGNSLGVSDEAYAPFTPVRVRGAETVEVVLRTLRMNSFGLWDSVVSRGEELLAAPMTVACETDRGPAAWTAGPKSLQRVTPVLARFASSAENPAVRLEARSEIEVDGCMRTVLRLSPGRTPAAVAGLRVRIPLKDRAVTLWHVLQSGNIRFNATGAVPAGSGRVWDSSRSGNGAMLGTFLPYIWLGGPERGLAVFANNDRGWATDDAKPVQTLTRSGGVLTLELRLIDRPVVIDRPREIVLGFQASPVKPMPADWRARTDIPMHGGSNGYWGIIPHFAGKYPAGNDYSFADALLSARRTGRVNRAFLDWWIAERIRKIITDWPEQLEDRTRHVGAGMNSISGMGRKPALIYFEEHAQDVSSPEWTVFQDEWGTRQYTDRSWACRQPASGASINAVRSYQDFALWHSLQWMIRGMGMYLDNTYPRDCYTTHVSDAYVREDGQVQPSACIWELREYHKRMWVLEQQCGPLTEYPLLKSVHMTNGNILPIVGWSDISLDNEWTWKTGEEPFPRDVLLTEMTGLQAGNYPHSLYPIIGIKNIGHGVPSSEKNARAEWGFRFSHEILRTGQAPALEKIVRDAGYGRPECAVLNYWKAGPAGAPSVSVADPSVAWTAVWNPETKKLTLAMVNWKSGPLRTTTAVLLSRKTAKACADAETGKAHPAGEVSLDGWGVRILTYAF